MNICESRIMPLNVDTSKRSRHTRFALSFYLSSYLSQRCESDLCKTIVSEPKWNRNNVKLFKRSLKSRQCENKFITRVNTYTHLTDNSISRCRNTKSHSSKANASRFKNMHESDWNWKFVNSDPRHCILFCHLNIFSDIYCLKTC